MTLETQEDKETSTAAAEESDDQVWCVCRKEEYGRMILCENNNCKIGWFHFGCVGLSRKPPSWNVVLCRVQAIDNHTCKYEQPTLFW